MIPPTRALLLVNGFSSQINGWLDGFREALAERGRHVISFDNRDVGLSTHLDGVEVDVAAVTAAVEAGTELPPVPYTLSTFAQTGSACSTTWASRRPTSPARRWAG